MSIMEDRVAEALAYAPTTSVRSNKGNSPETRFEVVILGEDEVVIDSAWPDLDAARQQAEHCALHIQARAAIEAMRQPTEAMVKEGDDAMNWDSSDTNGSWFVRYLEGDAAKSWSAMIDAALKDE
jgi:hypothetical protein